MTITSSLVVTGLIMGVRYFGGLQWLELKAFDLLMQLRTGDGKDSRILLVTIDDEDIDYQDEKGMERKGDLSSLSDKALAKLLKELEKLEPLIGLNIYHKDPIVSALPASLKDSGRFFVSCKAPDSNSENQGDDPPKDIPENFHGFTDLVDNDDVDDGIIRRHLLTMKTPNPLHRCHTTYSFSFLIATNYLHRKGIETQVINREWKFGDLLSRRLTPHTSGYQKLDAQGNQLLLNYRSYPDLKNVADQVSLKEILTTGMNRNLVNQHKNSIILIGTIAKGKGYGNFFNTPYGQISGVFLQAQMISQIISAVLDNRPLLWWWSGWIEVIWVAGWSVAGSILALSFRQRIYLVLAGGVLLDIVIFGICFFILTKAGWVPLVPPVFSLLVTQFVVVLWIKYYPS